MYITLVISTICTVALAAPVIHDPENRAGGNSTWQPAGGTTTSCDKTSDKIISFYVGPQMESVLTNACAAMMPPCAHPNRLADDFVCSQSINWRLDGPKDSTQFANVETTEGNKISGWDVKCESLKWAEVKQTLIWNSLGYSGRAAR